MAWMGMDGLVGMECHHGVWSAYRLDCRLAHEAIGIRYFIGTGMASYYFGNVTQWAISLQAIGTCPRCEPTVSDGSVMGQ